MWRRLTLIALDQIDVDRSAFSRLGVDTNFEADGLVPGDLIAFTACRHMKENSTPAVVRFYKAKTFFFVPHLNFASCHSVSSIL